MATKTTRSAKAAEPVETVEPTVPEVAADPVTVVKLPDLLDRIVEQTGQKKGVVKPIVEALLTNIAENLKEGTDLALPPLGRLRVIKRKEEDGPLTLKLRFPNNAEKTSENTLAEDDE
ncbi:HU family DNA-binding protein [Falsirhodobacter algicola]|uniref:DNA-binding protein n=1 Tax=Falsirhodobacter algicola TaxID=2692330 RepID=A0A8J8SKK9_9RHOB|nr:HU family DNA-binding protein [Falsirhodobacter algicola]QUS35576.1 hypothetical protein GR316_04405 [Falsirhodobacter algicola]